MVLPFKAEGVIPAALLAFNSDFSIDEQNSRKHLSYMANIDGLSAMTVNGHAAEVHACDFDEQRRILAFSADEIGDKLPLIQGVYADGSHYAAKIAKMAQDEGASALLIFPPAPLSLGGGMRPEMIRQHFKMICDASDLPIIFFQYPHTGPLYTPFEAMLSLFDEFPQIVAIKDWCHDGRLHERNIKTLHSLDRPVNVLTTHSAWLMSSLVMGCKGLLSGAGSVIAAQQLQLFNAIKNNDLAEAHRINDQIYPIQQAFYEDPFLDMHNRMKEANVLLGRLPECHVRPPLMKLSDKEIENIRSALVASGLLTEELIHA